MSLGFMRNLCDWVLTVPATLPPAAVQMFGLGFRAPFDIRQPKMRGAAIAPVAQRNTIRAFNCMLFLVEKVLLCLVNMYRED